MSDELATRIAEFLDAHRVMSLATCSPDGPHAANLFYARDGLALLWVSDPGSRHSGELERDARVSATVAPDYTDFSEICGLQITGRASRVIEPGTQAQARQILKTRYPFLARMAEGSDTAVRAAYQRAEVYRLDPARLTLIDNRRGFGHKEMLELGGRE